MSGEEKGIKIPFRTASSAFKYQNEVAFYFSSNKQKDRLGRALRINVLSLVCVKKACGDINLLR